LGTLSYLAVSGGATLGAPLATSHVVGSSLLTVAGIAAARLVLGGVR